MLNFRKAILAALFIASTVSAHAEDLVKCETSDSVHVINHLRIFQTDEGYGYEVSACEGTTGCTPYKSEGTIQRQITEIAIGQDGLSTVYKSDTARFLHLFGEYDFTDQKISLRFADATCTFSIDDKKDVVGRGDFDGGGMYGDCAHPLPISYPGLAKEYSEGGADGQAATFCAPLHARRISDYEIFAACVGNANAEVARAIYRCE